MNTVTVHIPYPQARRAGGWWVTVNKRYHHHVRAQLTRTWRDTAALLARHAPHLTSPVRVDAVIHFPDRRRRDLDGHLPTAKACLDGIQDAGALDGDDWRHVPVWHVTAHPASDTPGVTITLTEINPAAIHTIHGPPPPRTCTCTCTG